MADLVDVLLQRRYPSAAASMRRRIDSMVAAHRTGRTSSTSRGHWDERDAWLIAYPDQFGGEVPLTRLADVYEQHLSDVLNGVHVLPFCPWSSDDGYSIVDDTAVDPRYGTWADIERLARSGRLMVDAVVNHLSSESALFRGFLAGDPRCAGFFVVPDPGDDLAPTVRPRTSPLVHTFVGSDGPVDVWTTFSADQVDLDYRTPEVLLHAVGVLLGYAVRGAAAIRLDAVSYVWKQPGTTSINLPETHDIVRLLRACLDLADPDVLLITETNVPHRENVAYLGTEGAREAQAVYQFALPPLVLHSVVSGDVTALASWAAGLGTPPPGTTFFNFLASHDGLGLRPVEGILTDVEVDRMVAAVVGAGGLVSMRAAGGQHRPYELNTTWRSAVAAGCDDEIALRRHLASHAVMLSLRGVPGVYAHSLVASPNDLAGVAATGASRSINRARFASDPFTDRGGLGARCFAGMRAMLGRRATSDAFHPDAAQDVLDAPVFAVERRGAKHAARVYVNLSPTPVSVSIGPEWRGHDGDPTPGAIGPYEVLWLAA
jgi:sucrose phosphorylase